MRSNNTDNNPGRKSELEPIYLFSLPILKSHSNCRYLRKISLLSSNQIAISHFSLVAVKKVKYMYM